MVSKKINLTTLLPYIFALFLISTFGKLFAQETSKIERAKLIYKNLEYNTSAYDDLKPVWNINDPLIVRHIFNKLVNKGVLTINGKKIDSENLRNKIDDIYKGRVFIELRKRYYDDEIEMLRLFTENTNQSGSSAKDYFFDPIEDHLYIKSLLGEKTYEDIKARNYSHIELSKSEEYVHPGNNFDVYLHMMQPVVMFYTLKTNPRTTFLLSLFGNWGNDYLAYPGWYFPEYMAGIAVTYIDSQVIRKPTNPYKLYIGFGIDARQPEFEFNYDKYGKRLYKSGFSLYLKLSGAPLKMALPELDKLNLEIETMLSLSTYTAPDYGIDYISKFYSIRNYFVFHAEYKEFISLINFWFLSTGLGYATHDINHLYLNPALNDLSEINGDSGFKHNIVVDATLSSIPGKLNHTLGVQINYNASDGYGYFGFKSKLMISKVFGFEFKYYKAYKGSTTPFPFYRLDNYLVFSPIIRINY